MLDEEEKNVALSDKKKRMWVHKCFRSRKSEGEYWTLYKGLPDFISILECPSINSIICFRRLKKTEKRKIQHSEKQYHPLRN
jgi:hypothetical protein